MDISIIIPCYNEGKKIIKNIYKIKKYMEQLYLKYNIVIVNDGSKDDTLNYLNKLKDEKIIICTYEKNHGKGYAIKFGLEHIITNNLIGNYIIFMDADLSTDLKAISTVITYMNKYDVIIGSRRHIKSKIPKPQGFIRKTIGNTCIFITNIFTNLNLKDTQCGFKAFEKELIKDIVRKQKIEKFAFDVEYLYISKLKNKKIIEIPIIWINDEDSKVSTIKSSFYFFKDLLKIRLNKNKYLI